MKSKILNKYIFLVALCSAGILIPEFCLSALPSNFPPPPPLPSSHHASSSSTARQTLPPPPLPTASTKAPEYPPLPPLSSLSKYIGNSSTENPDYPPIPPLPALSPSSSSTEAPDYPPLPPLPPLSSSSSSTEATDYPPLPPLPLLSSPSSSSSSAILQDIPPLPPLPPLPSSSISPIIYIPAIANDNFMFKNLSDFAARFLTTSDEIYENNKIPSQTILTKDELNKAIDLFQFNFDKHEYSSEWVGLDRIDKYNPTEHQYPYVMKKNIRYNDQICFMGDINGNAHSLIRNLFRLAEKGHILDNFKIRNNDFNIVFTGNFTNNGRYGVETLYLILRLKCANWKNVHIIRGKQETGNASQLPIDLGGGLHSELQSKFAHDANNILENIIHIFRQLPLAVYFVNEEKEAIMATHAGMDDKPHYYDDKLKLLLNDRYKKHRELHFELREQIKPGYMFCKIHQMEQNTDTIARNRNNFPIASPESMLKMMSNSNIKALFIGHQEQNDGIKMFYDTKTVEQFNKNKTWPKNSSPDDPMHDWTDVIGHKDSFYLRNHNAIGLRISDHVPIIALSTGTTCDSMCIITISDKFNNWKVKLYEYKLTKQGGKITYPMYTTIKELNPAKRKVSTSGLGDGIDVEITPNKLTEKQQKEYLLKIFLK